MIDRNMYMPTRSLPALVFVLSVVSIPADAQELLAADAAPVASVVAPLALSTEAVAAATQDAAAPPSKAFEYSDAYHTRAKIHKYASFATLPLFATEFALGQSLYNTPTDSKKSAHIAIGSGIIGLYGVQGVTGVMNLLEANKDPNPAGKKRRMTHAILMLASGAGFAITPMVAPGHRDQLEFGSSSASTHRAVAFTSIGVGTAGYLLMLFGGK